MNQHATVWAYGCRSVDSFRILGWKFPSSWKVPVGVNARESRFFLVNVQIAVFLNSAMEKQELVAGSLFFAGWIFGKLQSDGFINVKYYLYHASILNWEIMSTQSFFSSNPSRYFSTPGVGKCKECRVLYPFFDIQGYSDKLLKFYCASRRVLKTKKTSTAIIGQESARNW